MLGYISETWCWGSTAFDDLGGHCRGIPICKHVFFSVKTREFNLSVSNRPMIHFTSSDPHHDMLGGGCQVRVVIENMMGRMENLRTLISGFLGLVILVRWALVTMFLS